MESRKLKTEFQSQRKPGTRPERKESWKEYLKAFNEFWQRQEEDMANTLAELSLCGDDKMESQDKDSISNQNVECNPTETGGGMLVSFSDSRIDSSPVNLEFRDSSSIKSEEFNGVFMFEDVKTAVEKPTSSFVTDVVNSNKPKRKLNDTTRTRYSFKPGNGARGKLYRRKPKFCEKIILEYQRSKVKIPNQLNVHSNRYVYETNKIIWEDEILSGESDKTNTLDLLRTTDLVHILDEPFEN